jgi:very-short-patch-repair endonuclease
VSNVLQRLARDQWIRIHGTPRITVLVGQDAPRRWQEWLALAAMPGTLIAGTGMADLDAAIREAYEVAIATPERPVAVTATTDALGAWRAGRSDRLAAMVDEGLLAIPDAAPPSASPRRTSPAIAESLALDARSAAEAAMFEALEATPSTAGRFKLNDYLSVRFGDSAAQVDLLSRGDRIAIEIDGYHHFGDATCYRRDRRKDLLLQTQGLLVSRFLAEDVIRDPRDAVNTVVQALAFRMGEST